METTTTTTHTPGPWEIVKDLDSGQSYVTYRIGRAAISTEKGVTCSNSSALMSVEEAEANARLIASAPDLLHQLKEARQYVGKVAADYAGRGGVFASRRLARMDAAIAQATGGEA